jgi:hypothetical protein
MRVLLPLAIAAAVLAVPAPSHRLNAVIDAGHKSEPYRFAIGYQFGQSKSGVRGPLHFGFNAAMNQNAKTRLPEFHIDGNFGLRLLPEGWGRAVAARLPKVQIQSIPVFPGAQ